MGSKAPKEAPTNMPATPGLPFYRIVLYILPDGSGNAPALITNWNPDSSVNLVVFGPVAANQKHGVSFVDNVAAGTALGTWVEVPIPAPVFGGG